MKQHIINKKDILIFDLDDTLYNELDFVYQGFRQVSFILEKRTKINNRKIFKELKNILKKNGRGKIFDFYCKKKNIYSSTLIKNLINEYRFSNKKINLDSGYKKILNFLKKKHSLYLVTDGYWRVQSKKVQLLKIRKYFKKIYYTDYYGKKASKPSLICFRKIKIEEKCKWGDMVYFGDNQQKDFKNLNIVGSKTFFVSRWCKIKKKYPKIYNANFKISNLKQINKCLD